MVQNLPIEMSPEAFMEHLDSNGFRDTYNYVYIPQSAQKGQNKGYAFVNFLSNVKPAELQAVLSRNATTKKDRFHVIAAKHQGMKKNLEQAVSFGLDRHMYDIANSVGKLWVRIDNVLKRVDAATASYLYKTLCQSVG